MCTMIAILAASVGTMLGVTIMAILGMAARARDSRGS